VAQPASDLGWHPKNLVCASDLHPETAPIAAYAYMIAHGFQATFTLLHIQDPTKTDEESDLQRFQKAFEQVLPNQPSPIIALRNSGPGYFSAAIVDFVTDRNADLIVMGAHAASFAATHLLRGLVPRVFTEAPCAISNHRLVAFENQQVSFRWRDYAHGGKNKVMTIPAEEFLRRYLLHVLPKGLVRIRHFGIFANRSRAASLQRCRLLLGSEPRLDPSVTAASQPPCPVCSAPMMMVQRITPQDLRYALIPTRQPPRALDSS
jgi:hypothetical protein